MTADVVLAKMAPRRVAECAAVLARSFLDNPLLSYTFPSAPRRERALRLLFAGLCQDAMPFGHVDTGLIDDTIIGVAVWLPPGAHLMSLARRLRLVPSFLRIVPIDPRGAVRVIRTDAASARVHPGERHWFLQPVGVDVGMQGRGIGTRLLAPTLDLATADRMPCYLYTSNPRNLPLYRRLGFDVRQEIHFLPNGPLTWTLWREP